ncbi:MAG: hypothetical protein ACNA8J_00205 [Gammaproteobacteria bacterium]
MKGLRILALSMLLASGGCATSRAPDGLAMPADDEPRAASLLAGYLLAQGWTVRLADETLVEAQRNGEHLRLEPLLDPAGLDRIMLYRTWPRAVGVDDETLGAFARELNDALNVGQFRVAPAGLVFQASLPFLEQLEPRVFNAFLAHTADVRLAVVHVQGERTLLAPLEDPPASR